MLVVAGIVISCTTVPLFVFCLLGRSIKPLPMSKKAQSAKSHEDRMFKFKLCVPLSMYFFLYVGMETTVYGLVSALVRKGLHWEPYKGALIAAVFQAAMGLSRLAAVPLSKLMNPRVMGTSYIAVLLLFHTLLTFALQVHPVIVWVSVAMLGVAMGPLFATGMLWASRFIVIDGFASGVIMSSASLGHMVFPALGSFLFQTFSYMSMLYLVLTLAILELTLFVLMHFFASKHGEILTDGMPTRISSNQAVEKNYKVVELERFNGVTDVLMVQPLSDKHISE